MLLKKKTFFCNFRCAGDMLPTQGSISWRRKVGQLKNSFFVHCVCNYFFVSLIAEYSITPSIGGLLSYVALFIQLTL